MLDEIFGKKSEKLSANRILNENGIIKNPKKMARVAGIMYLGVIILGIMAQVILMGIIVPGEPTETANNILDNEMLFSSANVIWLVSELLFLLLGVVLFVVLKPVNKNLAMLMLVFIGVGVAIECLNTLNNFAALQLLTSDQYSAVFTTEQLHAQALSYIETWQAGYSIGAILSFGPWLIVAGYLVYRSEHFPKILGVLVALAGIAILIENVQLLILPHFEVLTYLTGIVSVIGEFAFCGWLLVKGVKITEKNAIQESSVGDNVNISVS
jgi:hypothetical protein